MKLRRIVQESDTTGGRIFDLVVLVFIVLSIVTFSLETLPNLPAAARKAFEVSEIVITLLFTLEYGLRIAVEPRKKNYIFSFYGIVDLVAILPFYLASGVDLRALRTVRMLRIFRILKLRRYSKAIVSFGQAMRDAKEQFIIFGFSALIVLYVSAAGIYYFENEAQPQQFASIFHSLWWAVATLTAVGYGDIYPITAGGKIFTFVVLMWGLGIVAIPAGIIASSLSANIERRGRIIEEAISNSERDRQHEE